MKLGGQIFVKADGAQYRAKGDWTFNLGQGMREAIVGSDSVHGYSEKPQVPFIEGVITDTGTLNMTELLNLTDATITLELNNGKIIALNSAWFAGEGSGTTEQAEITARFEGLSAEEIR